MKTVWVRHALLICAGTLLSAQLKAADVLDELAAVPEPLERVRQMDTGLQAQFDAALADYDDRLTRNPHDVVAAVKRCRFIEEFASTHEYADFIDEIYESSTACFDELARRMPEHPEVMLAKLERSYGKECLDAALEILPSIQIRRWTAGQTARLYVALATAAQQLDDKRSYEFARSALFYDEGADVRLIVATELLARGDKAGVVETLTSAAEDHDPKDVWYLASKLRLLADAEARTEVLQVYSILREFDAFDTVTVASALRKVGAIAEAREALNRTTESEFVAQGIARERFLFELQHGDPAQALSAYDKWRDSGWSADPLAINRAALLAQAPLLPWRARDVLGIATLVAALGAMALLVSLPMAAVHYRGLARRSRSGESYPTTGWMLRHAWFALFAFFSASMLALYFVGPLDVHADAGRMWGLEATSDQIARITIIGDLFAIALLIPLGLVARHRQSQWWSTEWSPILSVAVGVLVALVLRAPVLLYSFASEQDIVHGATQQLLWQTLEAVRDSFGVASALWIVVLVAPIIEEFIFRAVLLRAFAAHVRFVWANILQAALFSLMHFDTAAAPMLFVVGLLAGYLARRSGGLLAPIAMHFVFNLVLALVMMF